MWRICAAVIANGIVVFGPAAVLSGSVLLGETRFLSALCGLSLALIVEIWAQSPQRALSAHSAREDRFAARFNTAQGLVLLAALQVLAVIAATENYQPTTGAELIGLSVLGMATALRFFALRQLGAGFADGFQPVAQIARQGPYRFFRHPAELGLVLLPVGFAILLGVHEWLVAVWPPVVVVSALRIRIEEHCMRQWQPTTHLSAFDC